MGSLYEPSEILLSISVISYLKYLMLLESVN